MDLDDQQQFKHGVKTLVACADVVRAEIQKHPFSEEQAERMVLAYWSSLIASAFAPDFGSLLRQMLPKDDE